MTTLDVIKVKEEGGMVVTKSILGDLSFSYGVRPRNHLNFDEAGNIISLGGVGISANKLKDVEEILKLIKENGYSNAYKIWSAKLDKSWESDKPYLFGFVEGKEAEKYAKDPSAYGEKVGEIRRRLKKKKR